MKYAGKLQDEAKYSKGLSSAMEMSLRAGNEELSLNLFKMARANEFPIRPHYFWPLLVLRGKANDTPGISRKF